MPKLFETPSAPKREYPALYNIYSFIFSIFVAVFARLDPEPDSTRIHADPDPKHCRNLSITNVINN
jgi:hypothetical protein